MTYRVIIQPRAQQDIQQAARFLLDQSKSPATALRWIQNIRTKLDTLKSQPLRCPIDPDSTAYGVETRVLLYGKKRGTYRILFTVQDDVVRILTIRHAAQQSLLDEAEDVEDEPLH